MPPYRIENNRRNEDIQISKIPYFLEKPIDQEPSWNLSPNTTK